MNRKITIGRSKTADVSIEQGSSIESISRVHAQIEQVSNQSFRLTDLGSSNGTYVYKSETWQKITSAQVNECDRIRLGKQEIDFANIIAQSFSSTPCASRGGNRPMRNPETGEIYYT